jgi:hypothetical protein
MSCKGKPRIYIAGPISRGDLAHNIRQANDAFWSLLRAGFAPLCPHWSCYAGGPRSVPDLPGEPGYVYAKAEALPNGSTHEDWMGLDLPWVAVADGVLRLPGESVGANAEVDCAFEHCIPVFRSVAEVIDWFRFPEGD